MVRTLVRPVHLDRPPETRPLFFYHVEKTGGTTLDWVLRAVLYDVARRRGGRWLALYVHRDPEAARKPGPRGNVFLYSGHVPYGRHLAGAPDSLAITLLRDPVRRTLSEYVMGAQFGWYEATADAFLRFIDDPIAANRQTHRLAGLDERTPPDRAALETAKRNLAEGCFLFAPLSGLDRFIKALLSLYGLPAVLFPAAQVGSYDRETFARGFRDRLRANAALDAELYACAESLFEARIGPFLDGPDATDGRTVVVPPNFFANFRQYAEPEICALDRIPEDARVV